MGQLYGIDFTLHQIDTEMRRVYFEGGSRSIKVVQKVRRFFQIIKDTKHKFVEGPSIRTNAATLTLKNVFLLTARLSMRRRNFDEPSERV